jgi:hypothetical protein
MLIMQIAMMDERTGELTERRLEHQNDERPLLTCAVRLKKWAGGGALSAGRF